MMLRDCLISGFADEINRDFDVQLKTLQELGQKYIELRAADGIGVADMTTEQAKGFHDRMNAAGIRVSAIGSPIGKIGITDDFEPHFEKFRHVVELAKLFDTQNIRMFSFYIPQGERPEDYREEVIRRLARMKEYAEEHQVILFHENEKGIYGDNAKRCLELFEALAGEHFRCIFDFANFVQCKQDTLEAYRMLEPYIAYVHVKDALMADGEVVVAGEGDGHVAEIFGLLEKKQFQGFLSLEPHLTNFSGLETLEASVRRKKEQDGIDAYKKAYGGLQKLLNL